MKNTFKKFLLLTAAILFFYGCAAKPLPDLVWPDAPDTPRIKFIKNLQGGAEFKQSSILENIFLGQDMASALKKPMSVHIDKDGKIFVTDTALGDIMIFDSVNKNTTSLGALGVRGIAKPIGIATDSATGKIYFTDSSSNKVFAINPDGSLIDNPEAPEPFKQPSGITVDSANRKLYVSDTQNHTIKVFDLETLKYVSTIGSRGKEEGQFNFPSHLTIDGKGKLYVTDTMNGRIQIFDNEGKFLKAFGELGDAPGMFARPKGVAVDSEGHIYVVDAAFNNVQVFDEEGHVLMHFAGYGPGRGQLILPAGVAVDKDDYIYVVDSWNRRVSVFEFLGEKSKTRKPAK
ncbi:6-bladed beta-propeller [bacterium]|nr:MAG: 6-bladed beta-propeller [bacterium]